MRALIIHLIVTVVFAKRIANPIGKKFSGREQIDNRIVGGAVAEEGTAKYQVSLQSPYGDHMCGGAILNNEWIATAGHCVEGSDPSSLFIISGTHQYTNAAQKSSVKEIHVHCNYNIEPYMNDIALLRLNEPIAYNNKTGPIQLPDEPLQDGDTLYLTGWGTTVLYGDPPEDLQSITVNYVPLEECKAAMTEYPYVGPYHVCTFTRRGEGACHGDSGGPLVHEGKLYGLVNWGVPCAQGHPDMQANVFYYLDWIRTTMDGCNSNK